MPHHLTPAKFRKAESILESYRQHLIDFRRMDCLSLECELCDCWNLEYADLRTAFIDLLHTGRFAALAAYYMQHERPERPAKEFLPHLAKLYGLESYDDRDRREKQADYWRQYFEVKSLEPTQAGSAVNMPRRSGSALTQEPG